MHMQPLSGLGLSFPPPDPPNGTETVLSRPRSLNYSTELAIARSLTPRPALPLRACVREPDRRESVESFLNTLALLSALVLTIAPGIMMALTEDELLVADMCNAFDINLTRQNVFQRRLHSTVSRGLHHAARRSVLRADGRTFRLSCVQHGALGSARG